MGIAHGMRIPEIPARRGIPGREKFEAIREGRNGNFPLKIPAAAVQSEWVRISKGLEPR